jgi:TolA-binding protein
MKFKWLLILAVGFGFLFTQCGTGEEETTETEETTPENEGDITKQLEYIKMLNEELTSGEVQNEQISATALFNAASDFVNNHPEHAKTPAVMELAAKASEVMGKPQQAVNIMQKLVDEFPVTNETPKYIANMARLYEEGLGDLGKAHEMYAKLIEEFPQDPLAIEAQNYVDNFLGKSEAEILMFLDSVNNSQ